VNLVGKVRRRMVVTIFCMRLKRAAHHGSATPFIENASRYLGSSVRPRTRASSELKWTNRLRPTDVDRSNPELMHFQIVVFDNPESRAASFTDTVSGRIDASETLDQGS
jgi:hypothetical protein